MLITFLNYEDIWWVTVKIKLSIGLKENILRNKKKNNKKLSNFSVISHLKENKSLHPRKNDNLTVNRGSKKQSINKTVKNN